MPAIRKIGYSETFSKLNTLSAANGETNDCAVKAVALVTGKLYDEAHRALAAKGRVARKGTYRHQQFDVIREFGKTLTRIDPREIIKQYPSPHRDVLKSVTTHHPRRFNKVWPKGTYLLFSVGHVSAVIDGVLHDWAVNSARRVTEIYEVK